MQGHGAPLRQSPEDARERGEEGSDAQRLVNREQICLQGELRRGLVRPGIGDQPERKSGQNEQRRQPVQGHGHASVTRGTVSPDCRIGRLRCRMRISSIQACLIR